MTADGVLETVPDPRPGRPELSPMLTIRAVQVVLWMLVISGPVAALLVANRVSSIGARLDTLGASTAVELPLDTTYVAMYGDHFTAFDPWSNGKLEDAAAKDHLMGFAGSIPPVAYEIVDPGVDLYGNIAIFSFNVELTNPAGGDLRRVEHHSGTPSHRRSLGAGPFPLVIRHAATRRTRRLTEPGSGLSPAFPSRSREFAPPELATSVHAGCPPSAATPAARL